jgi:hypothetical protein
LLFIVPALALATSSAAAAAEEKLRWKFTAGQSMQYAFTQETSQKTEANGQTNEMKLKQVMNMTWNVKSVESDGSAKLDQTIDRVVYTEKRGELPEVTFDSSKKDDSSGKFAPIPPFFQALVGSPILLKMSARGEVSDVEIPAKIMEAIKSAGPLAQTSQAFSEKGIKEMTSQGSIVLPEEALAPGFQWTSRKQPKLPFGDMTVDFTYTYKGKSQDLDRIDVTAKMDIKPAENSPLEVKVGDQSTEGMILFDNRAGALKSSTVKQKFQLPAKFMNTELKIDVETTAKMEAVK